MARQAKMTRRGSSGVWYARFYIPHDLQTRFRVDDKKISLRTKDEAAAKIAFNLEMVKWDREVARTRAGRDSTETEGDEDDIEDFNCRLKTHDPGSHGTGEAQFPQIPR